MKGVNGVVMIRKETLKSVVKARWDAGDKGCEVQAIRLAKTLYGSSLFATKIFVELLCQGFCKSIGGLEIIRDGDNFFQRFDGSSPEFHLGQNKPDGSMQIWIHSSVSSSNKDTLRNVLEMFADNGLIERPFLTAEQQEICDGYAAGTCDADGNPRTPTRSAWQVVISPDEWAD